MHAFPSNTQGALVYVHELSIVAAMQMSIACVFASQGEAVAIVSVCGCMVAGCMVAGWLVVVGCRLPNTDNCNCSALRLTCVFDLQGEAIAVNLREMFSFRVPIISVVIGEGGSGGALAIGCANRSLIMENSVYYVASPEACAAILWKSRKQAPRVRFWGLLHRELLS